MGLGERIKVELLASKAKQIIAQKGSWFELAGIVHDLHALLGGAKFVRRVSKLVGRSNRWCFAMVFAHDYRVHAATNLDAFEAVGWVKFSVLARHKLIGRSTTADLYWLAKAHDNSVPNLEHVITQEAPVGTVLMHLPLDLKDEFLTLLFACGASRRKSGRKGSLQGVPEAMAKLCALAKGAM